MASWFDGLRSNARFGLSEMGKTGIGTRGPMITNPVLPQMDIRQTYGDLGRSLTPGARPGMPALRQTGIGNRSAAPKPLTPQPIAAQYSVPPGPAPQAQPAAAQPVPSMTTAAADPFSVPLTPENFNEVWGARKAQIASSMPALAPRSPVQMPAMPANPMAPVVQPQTRSYPMYPGSGGWDTAPGWLARAGGVNTSTPEGRMFSAMNRPSVPVAKPAAPTGPSPWDIGTAAMNLGSPELVKPWESAADRHAQAAAQVRRMPPGGYLAAQLAALAGNLSTGPNISIPGGAEAVARAEAKRQQAATLAQSFDRLRERSKAVPFGTYLAGTPETIGNLTEDRDWIDPAKTVTEQMTWPEYVMKNRAQMAAMQQGRPFDLTPAWIGPSGRQRPPSTWDLAKENGIAPGIAARANAARDERNAGILPPAMRRQLVTMRAQGRRLDPARAAVELALASNEPMSDELLTAMNPYAAGMRMRTRADENIANTESETTRAGDRMRRDAAVLTAALGAMTPGEGGVPGANPHSVSQFLDRFGIDGGGALQSSPTEVPVYGRIAGAFSIHGPQLFPQFEEAVGEEDYEKAMGLARSVGISEEDADAYLQLRGISRPKSWGEVARDVAGSPSNLSTIGMGAGIY